MQRSKPKLFTVVLNWNGKEDLVECLRSLQASLYSTSILVVDNDSTDGSTDLLRLQFPHVTTIQNAANLGFAGNNVGIMEAVRRGAEYVFLVNNDTWVAPDCIGQLVSAAEEAVDAGLLSPRICYYSKPGIIWYDGGSLNQAGPFWLSDHLNADAAVQNVSGERANVDYVSGCAMLIKRSVIERIGGLDSRFFMYWEDVDYSLRAKAAGFNLVHEPSALVLHKVSRSSGVESPDFFYYIRSNRYFIAKRKLPTNMGFGLRWKHVQSCFWDYCRFLESGKHAHAIAVAEAGWDCLIGRSGRRTGRLPCVVKSLLKRRASVGSPMARRHF